MLWLVHIWNCKNPGSPICKCYCQGTVWGSILESLLSLTRLLGYIPHSTSIVSFYCLQAYEYIILLELNRTIYLGGNCSTILDSFFLILYHVFTRFNLNVFFWFSVSIYFYLSAPLFLSELGHSGKYELIVNSREKKKST